MYLRHSFHIKSIGLFDSDLTLGIIFFREAESGFIGEFYYGTSAKKEDNTSEIVDVTGCTGLSS